MSNNFKTLMDVLCDIERSENLFHSDYLSIGMDYVEHDALCDETDTCRNKDNVVYGKFRKRK
jgi:hypothetical protein